jgi:hypothetical protein
MRLRITPLLSLSLAALGTVASLAGSGAIGQEPAQTAGEVPPELIGIWQLEIAGRPFDLKANYNIEINIKQQTRKGWPPATVTYFAGDERRPSTICRSQLTLASTSGQSLMFDESLNYKAGKDSCPIWDQMAIQLQEGQLSIQWHNVKRRKVVVKMEGRAQKLVSEQIAAESQLCRDVEGVRWCRDSNGDWAPLTQ